MKTYRFSLVFLLAASLAVIPGCKKSEDSGSESLDDAASTAPKTPPKPKEKFALEAKPQVGKVVKTRISKDITAETTMGARSQTMDVNVTVELAHKVKQALPTGGAEVEMEVLATKLQNKGEQGAFLFDSSTDRKEDRANPLFKDFRKVVGKTVTYRTDPAGGVASVEDFDLFINKATRLSNPAANTYVRGLFTEAAIKNAALTTEGLPDDKVAEGESWEEVEESPLNPGTKTSMRTTAKYTFAGWEEKDGKRLAVIDVDTVVIELGEDGNPVGAAPAGGAAPGGGMEPGMEGRGEDPSAEGMDPAMAGEEAMLEDPAAMERGMAGAESEEQAEMAPGTGAEGAEPAAPAPPPREPGQIGSVKGKMWFDPESGLFAGSDLTTELDVEMKMRGVTVTRKTTEKSVTEVLGIEELPAAPEDK